MKLSVIVPVLNSIEFLPKLLDSILEQSEEDTEILCVDQGSSDGTIELVREYSDGTGERVRLIEVDGDSVGNPRLSRNIALNEGIRRAKGYYLHFLNARDEIFPYTYESILYKALLHDFDVMRVKGYLCDLESGETMAMPEFTMEDVPEGMYAHNFDFSLNSPRFLRIPDESLVIIKRNFLLENNIFFDETMASGFRIFITRIVLTAEKFSACRDRVILCGMQKNASFKKASVDVLSNMLKTQDVINEEILKHPGISKDVRIKILTNEFDGVCNYLARAISNPEEKELYLSVVNKYIEGKEPALYRNYNTLLKEAIRSINKDYTRLRIKKASIFGDSYPRPKVSVIVPVYNQERFLNHALETLCTQSLRQIEIIAINDGSTDISGAILKAYAALDKRIRVIDKRNTGYGHCVNMGIDAAKGDYIAIMEPDDFVPENMYEDMYLAASGYGVQIVRADFYWFWENPDGSYRKRYKKITSDTDMYNRVINPRKETAVFDTAANTWTGIYQRDFLNKYRLRHNESPGASFQYNGFFFTTMCKAEKVMMLNRPYYMYRKDNPNSSTVPDDSKMYCITNEFRWIRDWMEKNPETMLFESRYQALKFKNFLETYGRTSDDMRPEYLRHIREEFRNPLSDGVLTSENLTEWRYKTLCEMVKDPDGYFERIRVSACIAYKDDVNEIEDFITRTLGSNTMRMELLCINMGSRDGTNALIRELSVKDERIKPVEGTYTNAAAGYNVALASAKGDYFIPLSMNIDYESDYIITLGYKAYEKDVDICIASGRGITSAGLVPHEGPSYAKEADLLPPDSVFDKDDLDTDGIRSVGLSFFDKAFSMKFINEKNLKMHLTVKYFTQEFTARAIREAGSISVQYARRLTYPDAMGSFWEPDVYLDEIYEAIDVLNGPKTVKKNFANYALYRIGLGLLLCEGDFERLYDDIRFQRLAVYGIDDLEEDEIIDRSFIDTWRYIRECSAEEYLNHIRRNFFAAKINLKNDAVRLRSAGLTQKGLHERITEARKAESKASIAVGSAVNDTAPKAGKSWKMPNPFGSFGKKK